MKDPTTPSSLSIRCGESNIHSKKLWTEAHNGLVIGGPRNQFVEDVWLNFIVMVVLQETDGLDGRMEGRMDGWMV